ncbi:MAG: DUF262 domain-containing protein [Bacteroidota bacterium]
MKKEFNKEKWTIDKLVKSINSIEFPEFQREPSIWKLDKKQRLIDSIFRGFDISSIYLFKRNKDAYDCIDGQQRINAIWSFIGINNDDRDNKFHLKIENEVFSDTSDIKDIHEARFEHLESKWKEAFLKYELNIVFITKIDDDEELNLQFLRLQLGAPLRGGEKLNAMKGSMRDFIFDSGSEFLALDYFQKIGIRKERYGKQEVASQILLNAFSKKEIGEFQKSRYVDLQEFFKQKEEFTSSDKKLLKEVINDLVKIAKHFQENLKYINNKALAVSVYLFVSEELISLTKEGEIDKFADFFIKFLKTKKWQIGLGLDMNRSYREILNFQTSLTQAAGEKTAIQKRHDFWRDYFKYFKEKNGLIKGDEEYKRSERKDPNEERKKIAL